MVARKHRTHLPQSGESQAQAFTPQRLTKQEFGRRFYNIILSRGLRQSEAARQIGVERDKVSVYVRVKSFPTPVNLQRIAKWAGMKEEELLPNYSMSAIDEDMPAFEMK